MSTLIQPSAAPAAADLTDRAVDERAGELLALSHTIHGLEELAFEEHRSVAALQEVLTRAGFDVESGVGGLPTAFRASFGSGDLAVGICAEYDALPEIGHACGHNIIASSAVGAALALTEVADELGLRVVVLGTPAEEHGGGKVLMLEAGAFDDLACAVMIHPGAADLRIGERSSQGVARFAVTYTGRASHAAAAPQRGINAADAAVVAQVAIGLLRQQLESTARVACFVREGGQVTNIIPERVIVDAEVREFDIEAQRELHQRVLACFQAGATATGCTMTVAATEPEYEPLVQDARLARQYAAALDVLGRDITDAGGMSGGSTDMGNVSQYLPALHPIIGVLGSQNAPHTHGFAADAITTAADATVLDGAKALARTLVGIAADADMRAELLAEQRTRAPYQPSTVEEQSR